MEHEAITAGAGVGRKAFRFAPVLLHLFLFPTPSRFSPASLRSGFLLLGVVLLPFISLIYAAERGEYKHYLGFAISDAVLSDDLLKIDAAADDNSILASPVIEETGSLLVWDRFYLDNQAAFSLMVFSVWEDQSETFSDGTKRDGEISFWGPVVAGKYFTQSGFYVGGGGAFLNMVDSDIRVTNDPTSPDRNIDLTADSFFAPTLVLGYRGLISKLKKSHFYIGADWVRTLPVDVDYERSRSGSTISDTFEDLIISMIAISFGWAW